MSFSLIADATSRLTKCIGLKARYTFVTLFVLANSNTRQSSRSALVSAMLDRIAICWKK